MRPNSSNRRMRGRNNNRSNKNTNNPNRSYESNGPNNVRVRGNAQTIAEKYQTLSRDAQSAGDTILAEGYLQFAEHYSRIVAANQQQQQNRNDQNGQQSQDSEPSSDHDKHKHDTPDHNHPLEGTVAQLHAPQPGTADTVKKDTHQSDKDSDEARQRRRYPRRITPRRGHQNDDSNGDENAQNTSNSEHHHNDALQNDEEPKRKRGRPRKNPVGEAS
jgi:hypothetical protein